MDDSIEEYATPKIDGRGDGIKNITIRRVPVPSSRKFNARVQRDESLKLKLENALMEMQGKPKIHNCLKKKANTVAEITPTKTKAKKRPKLTDASDEEKSIQLHGTPRRFVAKTPRRCHRLAAACVVYQRMMLLAWRRTKARLDAQSESHSQQKEQIQQLELQVDVLRNLRNSESEKRSEAVNECQVLKNQLRTMELENKQLQEKLVNIKLELEQTATNLNLTKCDLKNCSQQVSKLQTQLQRKREEKLDLVCKLSNQELEILTQNATIVQLEERLKTTEMNLQNTEESFKTKNEELCEVFKQLQSEVELNCSLRDEVSSLQEHEKELEEQSQMLEDRLDNYLDSCNHLQEENTSIRNNLLDVTLELQEEKRKNWFKNTKELALLSLSALQKIATVVLPVFVDGKL